MQAMVSAGYTDMLQLAEMPADELIKALSTLTDDYQAWMGSARALPGPAYTVIKREPPWNAASRF